MSLITNGSLELKTKRFVDAVDSHRDWLLERSEISEADKVALIYGLKDYSNSSMVRTAVKRFVPNETLVYGPKMTTVVTPSTGLTTSVEALMNPYLLSESVRVKISKEDPYTSHFVDLLYGAEHFTDRDQIDYRQSDVMIVYGSDSTVESLQCVYETRNPRGKFIGYGSKFSVAVYESAYRGLVDDTVKDIKDFGGLGCLNTHVIFYNKSVQGTISQIVEKLETDEEFSSLEFLWQASQVEGVKRAGDFAVEISPKVASSWDMLPRGGGTVVLAPYDESIEEYDGWFSRWSGSLSSVVLSTEEEGFDEKLITEYGFSRVTTPGRAQEPGIYWIHDGVVEVVEMCNFVAEEF